MDLSDPTITFPMDMLTFYCSNCHKEMNISCLKTDFRQGTSLCGLCGMVIEDRIIDFTEEIRKFSNERGCEKNLSRLNGGFRNDNLADGGLSLAVSGATSTIGRMAQRLGVTSAEQSKVKAHKLIREWGNLLGILPMLQSRAREGFDKMFAQMDHLKGYSVEHLTAAILLIVCKGSDVPISPRKVSETCGVSEKDLKRGYKHAKDYVKVEVDAPVAPVADEIKYCRALCLAFGVASLKASKVAEKIKELGLLDGRDPRTCAAVAVSLAFELQPGSSPMWKDLVENSPKTESTIKNGLKIVKPRLNEILSGTKNNLPSEKAAAN